MARGAKCRFVEVIPAAKIFMPVGLPNPRIEGVVLKIEEVEAIRLKNYLGLEQEECAERMQVSRPTFQRILTEAQSKVADALVNSKSIRIEGGSYCLGHGFCRRLGRDLQNDDNCPLINNLVPAAPLADHSIIKKIAVTTSGNTLEDKVDERFGRCHQFLIYDVTAKSVNVIENRDAEEAHGVGLGAADLLIGSEVDAVITLRIGVKAFALLQRAGIAIYLANENDSIGFNIDHLLKGELARLEQANN